jgi:hypothetical protein
MIRECQECGDLFDDQSPEKRDSGGLIVHCPDCSCETQVKYLGIQHSDGKQAGCEVLAFSDPSDRNQFLHHWRRNSGINRGKSSALGVAGNTISVPFKKVASFEANVNHKGKS